MRFILGLFLTLFICPALVCAKPISKLEQEKIFSEGLLGGCRADLAVFKDSSKKVNMADLDGCHREISLLCKVDLGKAKKLVTQKSKFFGDPTQVPSFSWTEAKKKTYSDVVLRKLCAGAISEKMLRELDAILFLNTECTGERYLNEVDRLKAVPGINELRMNSTCQMGGAASFTVSIGGKSYSLKVLFVNPAANTQGLANGNVMIGQLDTSMVHEFTHIQRQNDKNFRRWTDQVLNLRFDRLQKNYLHEMKKVEADINAEATRIEQTPHIDDQERLLRIKSYANKRMDRFREWLVLTKIPLRHGMGSSGRLWSEGNIEDQAGTYTLKDLPSYKNGKPTKFEFRDLVSGSDPYSVEPLDSYALKNKEEYIAVALEIYWHNRTWSEQVLSKDELQLLDKNWRFGYFTR